jgi:hypothetical protein
MVTPAAAAAARAGARPFAVEETAADGDVFELFELFDVFDVFDWAAPLHWRSSSPSPRSSASSPPPPSLSPLSPAAPEPSESVSSKTAAAVSATRSLARAATELSHEFILVF